MASVGEPDLVKEETESSPIPESNGPRDDEAAYRDDQPKLKGPARAGDSAVDVLSLADAGESTSDQVIKQQLKEKDDEIKRLLLHIKHLEDQLTAEKNDRKLTEKKIERLNLADKQQEEIKQRKNELQVKANLAGKRIESLESELNELKTKLDQERERYNDLASKKEKLENELKEVLQKLNDVEDRIEKSMEEKQTLLLHLQKLKGKHTYDIGPGPDGCIGTALIISIHEVKLGKEILKREYAKEDDDLLERTLIDMKFRMLPKLINCTRKTITKYLQELDKDIQESSGMFLCFIASHGGCDAEFGEFFFGCNGHRVYLEDVYNDIGKCQKLKGKPKLLVVYACLGRKKKEVTDKSDLSHFLILFSAAPKHCSYESHDRSDDKQGSSYVKAFCDALKKWDTEVDLETIILEDIHRKIQQKKVLVDGVVVHQCPFILSSLSGRLTLKEEQ